MVDKIKTKILKWLRLSYGPQVKLYNGFGNQTSCIIFGHVLALSPLPRKRYRQNYLLNTLALLRLFFVRPVRNVTVRMRWGNDLYTTKTATDGFFRFEWTPGEALAPGEHKVEASFVNERGHDVATGKAYVIVPQMNQYSFISDIDDTFLISHSSNLRKRLFVLLTENARSRKTFEGVVNHYNLLSYAGAPAGKTNPFFYVSSSEWNLYDYIVEFCSVNKLPKGVFLLNQLKTMNEILKTGQNNHGTKFMRIARVLEAYPSQQFILLGDDTQEDPFIYKAIADHFPGKIVSIYIRQVARNKKPKVEEELKQLDGKLSYCYFKHSAEAVMHSKKTGLVQKV